MKNINVWVEIKCDGCDFFQTLRDSITRVYINQYPKLSFIPVLWQPGWCFACHGVVPTEQLPQISEIEEYPHEEDKLAWKTWRENRKSSPKCLQCGATDFLILPDFREEAKKWDTLKSTHDIIKPTGKVKWDNVFHPDCQGKGKLIIFSKGFYASTARVHYSPDGEVIKYSQESDNYVPIDTKGFEEAARSLFESLGLSFDEKPKEEPN